MKRIFLIALSALLLAPLWATTYTPSSVPSPKAQGQGYYVANPDAILADSTVQWLNQCAAMLDEKTHVEMAIVAIEAMEETTDAFDFAYELFQRWGIGHEGQNTGVLILFVLDTHDLRIMTGTGIEGVLTDAKCSQIMHDEMFPAFQAGDYDGGLCLGALAIYETCTDGEAPEELLTIRSVTNRGGYASEDELTNGEMLALMAIGFSIVLVVLVIYFAAVKKCPECKKRKAHAIRTTTLVAATYSHSGKQEVTYRCRHCGHVFTRLETIPRLTRTSSSGGGSFGGGSFGGGGSWGGGSTSGGGAGGRW